MDHILLLLFILIMFAVVYVYLYVGPFLLLSGCFVRVLLFFPFFLLCLCFTFFLLCILKVLYELRCIYSLLSFAGYILLYGTDNTRRHFLEIRQKTKSDKAPSLSHFPTGVTA